METPKFYCIILSFKGEQLMCDLNSYLFVLFFVDATLCFLALWFDGVSICFNSAIRSHLGAEGGSIALAKEFLRNQKLHLRHRQAMYRAAKREWDQDVVRYQLGVRLCFGK